MKPLRERIEAARCGEPLELTRAEWEAVPRADRDPWLSGIGAPFGAVSVVIIDDDLERFAAAKAELGRQLRAVPPWSWCERLVAWLERRRRT